MLQRTETPAAPWHVIAANDKYYARVKILEVVTDTLNQALKQ
jgi:polyphosphate kinase 2 (PPK2 family)